MHMTTSFIAVELYQVVICLHIIHNDLFGVFFFGVKIHINTRHTHDIRTNVRHAHIRPHTHTQERTYGCAYT